MFPAHCLASTTCISFMLKPGWVINMRFMQMVIEVGGGTWPKYQIVFLINS